MTTSAQWQLASEAAERYERILVPAILGPFARALVDMADVRVGETVLDVGCGTGAAARFAAGHVGPSGRVIGVDRNAAMLDVARSAVLDAGTVEWHEGDARDLPLPDGSVNLVLCAQTLQFLSDREQVLAEMRRVLAPGGRLALSLWCPLSENVYFDALVTSVAAHLGDDVAAGLRAAFGLSEPDDIQDLLSSAGFRGVHLQRVQLELPLPELSSFVPRHISATPMSLGYDAASSAARERVVRDVVQRLAAYEGHGSGRIPFRSHAVLARRT